MFEWLLWLISVFVYMNPFFVLFICGIICFMIPVIYFKVKNNNNKRIFK